MELSTTLFQLSSDMKAIEDALWESGGELTPELESAMAENAESMAKKVDAYNAVIRSFAYKEDVLASEIKRLTALKKVAENAQKRIKKHILDTMTSFGIEKLEGSYCRLGTRSSTSTEVDEEVLLSPYRKMVEELNAQLPPYVSVTLKVSKDDLKKYCQSSGIKPKGVEFVTNQSLTIK